MEPGGVPPQVSPTPRLKVPDAVAGDGAADHAEIGTVSASERSPGTQSRRDWAPTGPLRHPVLFVNPSSGGGKARRAGVAEQAGERGIEAVVLEPGSRPDSPGP